MKTWAEHLACAVVYPGDIVEVLPDGKYGMPALLDLANRPARYRPGSYCCLNCHNDPYDPRCCRQQARMPVRLPGQLRPG